MRMLVNVCAIKIIAIELRSLCSWNLGQRWFFVRLKTDMCEYFNFHPFSGVCLHGFLHVCVSMGIEGGQNGVVSSLLSSSPIWVRKGYLEMI